MGLKRHVQSSEDQQPNANIHVTGATKREGRENGEEYVLKEILPKIFQMQ